MSWQYALPRNVHPASKRSPAAKNSEKTYISYSHVTVTAGGVGAELFHRRYASAANAGGFHVPLQKQTYVFASTR